MAESNLPAPSDKPVGPFIPLQTHVVGITLEDALNIPAKRHHELMWFLDDAMRDKKNYTKSDIILTISSRQDLTTTERTYLGYMFFQRLVIKKYGIIGEKLVATI